MRSCTEGNGGIIRSRTISFICSAYANSNLFFSKIIRFTIFTDSNTNTCTCLIFGCFCRPADSRYAAPGQGTGRKGYGDDAG